MILEMENKRKDRECKMKNLAIITARSGSKGLPDKNIKELCGKPLLAYSVEAALQSGMFETVHVSTDSEKYAEIAREAGADVPFLRDELTSSDTAGSWDVVREVLEKYRALGQEFDTVTLLQPTSPLRTAQDIRDGYELFYEKQALSVVAVCEMEHSPLWSNTLPENHCLAGFLSKAENIQRQQLDTYYRINGALYIADVKTVIKKENLYGEKSFALLMPQERSIDIDTELDFLIAQTIMQAR